jgi:tartrate-resistant acid phosphatase type 5
VIDFKLSEKMKLKALLIFFLLGSCVKPLDTQRPLIFYVIGDWGKMGNTNQKGVASQMNEYAKNENPQFIITTGDNFYEVGVKDVNDSHWQESFEKVYNGDLLIQKPWYVSLGNHDYYGNADAEIEYGKINKRWVLPSRYWSRIETADDGSRIRFIFIDTSPFEKSYYQAAEIKDKVATQDTLRQKKWIDSLTSLNDVDWKIVVGHHHIYTGGLRKNDPNSVRASLEPVFAKNKVDAYFGGHEHDLQHLKGADKPTHYFLSGAGSDIRPTGTINETLFAQSIQGFMSASVKKKSLEVKVLDYKGNVIHTATLSH